MPGKELRLLALDGGGIRGLSTLMILEQLMQSINADSPPKPCEFFDMIGGTSTGGLIAIMLGRLKMSIKECIDAYTTLSAKVFKKKRHRLMWMGKFQGRFDSAELERSVKKILVERNLQENELLKDASDSSCKVFVCATSKETSKTVRLTSYKSPRGGTDLLDSVTIWEACRATSAATSFFDPIAIGPYREMFVDGATGANNPVYELWNEAQDIWGREVMEDGVKILVSVGTGMPSLKPFRDDMRRIGKTLVAIATETEKTAETFARDKMNMEGRYLRFNVLHGLEDIGLEESKKIKEIAAATRHYIALQSVKDQMRLLQGNPAMGEYLGGEFKTPFSLKGVPVVKKFIDRPMEMDLLEQSLLPKPRGKQTRRKVFVLCGLGGIGKTQLAVEFARKNHQRFSSVFWIDGKTKESLRQSFANCASQIPEGQIPDSSRNYAESNSGDVDLVVKDVRAWLSIPRNSNWLLIFDNVDRDYQNSSDMHAYDIKCYFPDADQGSVLITTRLAKLEQLGDSVGLSKVSETQAQDIFNSWYDSERREPGCKKELHRLLNLLDGLPLAIAQAGAYIQETGVGLRKYIKYYERQWKELMEHQDRYGHLQDYSYSIWTTWVISYKAIRDKNKHAANLLLLWAHLDNNDFWYGIFQKAVVSSRIAGKHLSEFLQDIPSNELCFNEAVRLLCNYSLVERTQEVASYAMHPVVHSWAKYTQDATQRTFLSWLAVFIVGIAVPGMSTRDYWKIQRRLLPHAERCGKWILSDEDDASSESHNILAHPQAYDYVQDIFVALYGLQYLFLNWDKHLEAKSLVLRALDRLQKGVSSHEGMGKNAGKLLDGADLSIKHTQTSTEQSDEGSVKSLQRLESALEPVHSLTVRRLGLDYEILQGRIEKAELFYKSALEAYDRVFGPESELTLEIVVVLGSLYSTQERMEEAEGMYLRALEGWTKTQELDCYKAVATVDDLAELYAQQGRLDEAETMYLRAVEGYMRRGGPEDASTLQALLGLSMVYSQQDELEKAKEVLLRALAGCEKTYGLEHPFTLGAVHDLADIYRLENNVDGAEKMLRRVLEGYELAFGPEHSKTRRIALDLGDLLSDQGRDEEAKELFQRGYILTDENLTAPENIQAVLNRLGDGETGIGYIEQKVDGRGSPRLIE